MVAANGSRPTERARECTGTTVGFARARRCPTLETILGFFALTGRERELYS